MRGTATLLVLLAHFFIVSCSEDLDTSPKPERDSNLSDSEYALASCQYDFWEGDAALLNVAEEFRVSHFEKKYEYSALKAVLSASAQDTIDHMEYDGLEVFKMESDLGACHMFSSLPEAPFGILSSWSDDPDGKQVTLGQYFPVDYIGNSKAQIALRSDTDRWTLIHEYFHHLFHRELEESYSEVAGKHESARLNLVAQIEVYKADSSSEALGALVVAFADLYDIENQLLVGSALEEASIEGELMDHYKAGRLAYVPTVSEENANWYLKSNLEIGLNRFLELQDLFLPMATTVLRDSSEVDLAVFQRTKKVMESLKSRISEIRMLKYDSYAPQFIAAALPAKGKGQMKANSHRSCPWANRFSDLLSKPLR